MNIKNTKFYLTASKFKDFIQKTDIKFAYFAIPALLSLGSAFLEGIGIALLLPLVKGIFQEDFSFVTEIPAIKTIINWFPEAIYRSNTFIFAFLLGSVFVATVSAIIMRYFANITVSYQLRKFSDKLRRLIFNRYLSFGKLFFDRNNLGYLHNILTAFTNQIATELRELQQVFNQLFALMVYLVLMFFISYKLTLLSLFILPILSYSSKWLIKKIRKTSGVYASLYKKLNESIFNILSCLPLVKIYAREDKEKEEFSQLSNNLYKIELSLDKKNFLFGPIQEIVLLVSVLLLVSAISFMFVKEKAGEISGYLVFFYLLKKTANNFNIINLIKKSLAYTSGPISEILKIFDDKDKFFVVGGRKEFFGLERKIEFKNLSFSYTGKVTVLENITFSIDKGKTTALVGATGAGKTTLVNLLLRFYECPVSSIFIDGVDIREFSLGSLLKHIALVSQEVLLFNDTLRNNIVYGSDGKISEETLIEVLQKARLYDYVMRLPDKFNTYIGDRGVKLSGGEKQRLSIARALLKKAEILILDEATSSLDSKTETLIHEAINETIKGKTTIVIAHRLSTIKDADKIVVIEEGNFMEEGTLEELLEKKGKFYQYWEKQKFY